MTAAPTTPPTETLVPMPAISRPAMIKPEHGEALPESLTSRSQWVNWTYECRGGKWTKCPRTPTRAFAKSDTPSTWSTFAEVMAAADRRPDMGVGFVFAADDPFIGIDLDDCLAPDGTLKAWGVPIMKRFGDTYAEVSPSGHGIKLWARASLAGLVTGTGTRRPCGDGQVEIYQRGRFFTVTGRRFEESPLSVTEHQADAEWLLSYIGVPAANPEPAADPDEPAPAPAPEPARDLTADDVELLRNKLDAARANIPKFAELWEGGACGYWADGRPDASRADLAFCNLLAFHLGLDAAETDRAFRLSARARGKWDEVHYSDGRTYGQATIAKAIDWATQERQRSATGKVIQMPANPAAGSIAELNAMPVFAAIGLAWEKFEMSGDLIFGYATGQRVKWESTAELLSFAKSQAIILKYLRTLIPSPPRAKIKAIWEPAAGLMVRLATVINSGDEMMVELSDLIPMCFRRAGSPVARSDAEVFRFMIQVREWRRDPYTTDAIDGGSIPAPFVFVYDGAVFVNAHKLRLWTSLPRVTATMLRKAEVARELASLGFKYHRGVERLHERQRVTMDLWRGPLSALAGSLEENDVPGSEVKQ